MYRQKYLKYKTKYLALLSAGSDSDPNQLIRTDEETRRAIQPRFGEDANFGRSRNTQLYLNDDQSRTPNTGIKTVSRHDQRRNSHNYLPSYNSRGKRRRYKRLRLNENIPYGAPPRKKRRLNICGVPPGGRQEIIDLRTPPGWEIRQSRKTGRLYYANPRLKITQWQRPSI